MWWNWLRRKSEVGGNMAKLLSRRDEYLYGGKSGMAQSVLPDKLKQPTIFDMQVGMAGYVTPWAMWADAHNLLWINGSCSVYSGRFGTAKMRVLRTIDGVTVDLHTIKDERYLPGDSEWDFLPDKLPVTLA